MHEKSEKDSLPARFFIGLAIACLAFGFFTIIAQAFLWLRNGSWPEWDLLFLVVNLFGPRHGFVEWLKNPAGWVSAHKIVYGLLDFINAGFALMLLWASLSTLAEIIRLREGKGHGRQ